MERTELKLGVTLAAVIATRMLGLFLVLPVLVLLAADLPGYTPLAAGLAIGVYGLTQALLQQPFGRLSDRWGRRRIILLGLALFVAGSVLAALADGMVWLIAGRALQGCGAIAGVTLAFAADHTGAARRSTIMAMIGMGIGAAFLVSIMVSVPLASLVGLRGLFWVTAGLGVLGMALVMGTPGGRPAVSVNLQESEQDSGIAYLCASVFLLHAMMTTLFVVLPGMLLEVHALQLPQHWKVYVPTMLVSVLLVFPLIRWASLKQAEQSLMPWAFALLSVPFALFSTELSLLALGLAVVAYFLAFNLLEAVMPSLVSRRASPAGRGRKMGRFATFQFLGAFAGGILGGGLMQAAGPEATMLAAALVCIAWAFVSRIVLKAGNRPNRPPGLC
ncbi:MAG TPA: MFS transporter [Xanthomonadales bacterium]|nr:MFS transporter [Xanthomonadales bacterium]